MLDDQVLTGLREQALLVLTRAFLHLPVAGRPSEIRRRPADIMDPPEKAVLLISLRSLSHKVHETLKEKLISLVRSVSGMFHCESEIESLLHVPLLDNSEQLYDIARRAAIAAAGPEHDYKEAAQEKEDISHFMSHS